MFESIMTKMRDLLISRGLRGILGLCRIFRVMDSDRDGFLNFYEFYKGNNLQKFIKIARNVKFEKVDFFQF